jgi:hypothetical protein
MLDGTVMPRCFATVLSDIIASNFAQLDVIIFNDSARAASSRKRSTWKKLSDRLAHPQLRQGILYEVYSRWEGRNAIEPDPLELVDYSAQLQNIDRIDAQPIVKGFVHRFTADTVDLIRSRNLDVIVRFGFNIIRGDILSCARYGIWSFHHGDNDFYRGAPPHLWEMIERSPLSGVVLQVLSEELDGGLVLCKSLFPTRSYVSLARNRFGPYWGTVHFVIWKLYELHQFGWDFVVSRAVPRVPYAGRKKVYKRPNNLEMARWLGPPLLKKAISRLTGDRDQLVADWRVAIRAGREPLVHGERGNWDFSSFEWIRNPPGRFYADPCLFEHKGQTWLFMEDYDHHTESARISACPVFADGKFGDVVPVLERPHHLSYPMVISHDGEIFMIPESGEAECVELYRATRFPWEWKLEKVLFQCLRLVDTTPLFHEGRWYFFTSAEYPAGHANLMLLFHADSLTDKWHLHPASPVSSDVRTSRSAGPIMVDGNRIVRSTQDCSNHYGYAFRLNEINRLDPDGFSEATFATVEPHHVRGLAGIHAYHRWGAIEVIDGFTRRARNEVLAGAPDPKA